MSQADIPVLYADDDENDVFLMERAFSKLKISNPLRTVSDGKLAVAFLSSSPPYEEMAGKPKPCLVLLDLSMPGKHGLEVLKWMKGEAALSKIPVVVLSSSNQKSDVHRAYLLGADGYIIKPGDPDELIRIVKAMQDYWLADNRPPGQFIDFAGAGNVPRPLGL
jgi:CheY-like chemotaxis protein